MQHWTMVGNDWPWSTMVYFHIVTKLSQCDDGPWLKMIDFHTNHDWFSFWYNPLHNTKFKHGWPWLKIVDHSWLSYWDNICYNVMLDHGWPWMNMVDNGWQWLNMVDFHSGKICVTMWRWTLVDEDYKLKGFILNPNINIINHMNNITP